MSESETKSTDHPGSSWQHSLSTRLFVLTIGVILLVEALIFIPSAASFRADWLDKRVQGAHVAALALDATPTRMVSEELAAELLKSAEVLGVAETEDGMRFQLLAPVAPITGVVKTVDLRQEGMMGSMNSMVTAMATFFAPEGRTLLIIAPGSMPGRTTEVLVPELPLKQALIAFGYRVVGLSLLISFITGALVYTVLFMLVVRPMRHVTANIERFRDNPGARTHTLELTSRQDEIGRTQNALVDMETVVSDSFRQRERLAQLGEAMAKINHDLRNSLAAAQLVSDGLARSEDPRVQRAAPRLERVLKRAIKLATDTLQYGKTETPTAEMQTLRLHETIEEAAHEALATHTDVVWVNEIPEDVTTQADPDHLHRIASNLIRNAAEALAERGGPGRISAMLNGAGIEFSDDGPGLPEQSLDNLFKPFAGSSKTGGTGLGLTIARDLARSMGGDLTLARTGPDGTVFHIAMQIDEISSA